MLVEKKENMLYVHIVAKRVIQKLQAKIYYCIN